MSDLKAFDQSTLKVRTQSDLKVFGPQDEPFDTIYFPYRLTIECTCEIEGVYGGAAGPITSDTQTLEVLLVQGCMSTFVSRSVFEDGGVDNAHKNQVWLLDAGPTTAVITDSHTSHPGWDYYPGLVPTSGVNNTFWDFPNQSFKVYTDGPPTTLSSIKNMEFSISGNPQLATTPAGGFVLAELWPATAVVQAVALFQTTPTLPPEESEGVPLNSLRYKTDWTITLRTNDAIGTLPVEGAKYLLGCKFDTRPPQVTPFVTHETPNRPVYCGLIDGGALSTSDEGDSHAWTEITQYDPGGDRVDVGAVTNWNSLGGSGFNAMEAADIPFVANADITVNGAFIVLDWPTETNAEPHGAFGYIPCEAKPGATPVADGETFNLTWQVECIQEKRWDYPTALKGRSTTLSITGA